jgi:Protein of unknown function (DUF2934)
MTDEERIREIAYFKWQEAGCPHGRDQIFWELAVESFKIYKLWENRHNQNKEDDYDDYEGPIDEDVSETSSHWLPGLGLFGLGLHKACFSLVHRFPLVRRIYPQKMI